MFDTILGAFVQQIVILPYILGSVGYGAAVGAFSAWMGWVDTPGTPFDPKKFTKGIITGAIAGVIEVYLIFGAIQSALETDTTGVTFVGLMIVLTAGIWGADVGTSKVGGLIMTFFGSKKTEEPTPV